MSSSTRQLRSRGPSSKGPEHKGSATRAPKAPTAGNTTTPTESAPLSYQESLKRAKEFVRMTMPNAPEKEVAAKARQYVADLRKGTAAKDRRNSKLYCIVVPHC